MAEAGRGRDSVGLLAWWGGWVGGWVGVGVGVWVGSWGWGCWGWVGGGCDDRFGRVGGICEYMDRDWNSVALAFNWNFFSCPASCDTS